MGFQVTVVGRPRDPHLAAAVLEYECRAMRYWPLAFVEVRSRSARGLSPALVQKQEGERLVRAVPEGSQLIACDEGGRAMSSVEFAAWLTAERDKGANLAFIVGGAFGIAQSVKAASRRVLSLSRLTLPHELARLVLAEQLYRAGTIMRGEPYHK
jgi:23S rRNA (pseudouridine1915-N3)-methyltransferase